jgi:hypothetical protein
MSHVFSDKDVFELICMMVILGVMGVFYGLQAFRIRRYVEDTACSKINSAAQGLTEVQGQAWPTTRLKSVDGRPICYWHLQVQKYKKNGKNSSWVTVHSHRTSDPLILMDGTGACLVVPEKADVNALDETFYMHKLSQQQRDYLTRAIPEAAEYFSLAGQILGGMFGGNVRVIERKILAGGPMYVRGEFTTQAGSFAKAVGDFEGYSSQYGKINSPGYQARMFDLNGDGRVSGNEFINGYSFAASAYTRKDQVQTVGMSGHIVWSDAHGLLVADTHQNYFLERLAYSSTLALWGGAALLIGGICLFFFKLGLS